MYSSIYNYFLSFQEFEGYLGGSRFSGKGITAMPVFSDSRQTIPTAHFEWSTKKGFSLNVNSSEFSSVHDREGWNESDWERKEDLFRFTPNDKEEVFFQALDRNRMHMLWKSDRGIVFSGTLERVKTGILRKLFGNF
ncbi:hypothetical protein LEP1GSC058_0535 [Leptospira fainei serovar Hurstbridge str. BUT 6]|uniref:Uncharacterized protein n=1 Tax=Leptospira fainei serovar Hurstbridge str. BUT 6 TaxID=1193011 RepID=S3VHP2_9LEPT|nr:hypothetical protein [Leptospira fainei]EPG75970.1 hypothetical protein LEP1GSC058_0535 [Leptospira fainei serovar Hurstbridge str. BUT 6]